MERLSIGTVVLARFPFSDLPATKLRPCLVIGLAEFNDIILCQITSKAYGSKRAIPLRAKADFDNGLLVTNSFIRPDKLATLDQAVVAHTLGIISQEKLAAVATALKQALELG